MVQEALNNHTRLVVPKLEVDLKPTMSRMAAKTSIRKLPSGLPRFRGLNGMKDPQEFLNRFRRICNAEDFPESQMGRALSTCLEDTDATWLEGWLSVSPEELKFMDSSGTGIPVSL